MRRAGFCRVVRIGLESAPSGASPKGAISQESHDDVGMIIIFVAD